MRTGLLALLVLCGVVSGCGDSASPEAGDSAANLGPEIIELNNRGVALMGQFAYPAAVEVFSQVVAAAPQWALARENLAIATLNRQQPGDEAAALLMLEQMIAADPAALRAHYMAGILNFNAGGGEAALAHFETVANGDPTDAHAWYFTGQSLLQLGEPERALEYFRRSAQLDPYLRSAAYGVFLALQRLGQRDAAREALKVYEKLEGNPRSQLAEIRYTRMGPKAMALALRPMLAPSSPTRPAGPLFAPAQALDGPAAPIQSVTILGADGHTRLAFATTQGAVLCEFQTDCQLQAQGAQVAVTAAAWGDYDNDGLTDLYLAGPGPNRLLRAMAGGSWDDVTMSTGTAGQGTTADVAFIDADHDGDLDLLLAHSDAPSQLLSNNGDGTFRLLDEFTGPLISAVQIAATDLDGDRDLDVLLVGASAPHQVLINDRLWQYHNGDDQYAALAALSLRAAVFADLDVDGLPELVALSGDRLQIWSLAESQFRQRSSFAVAADSQAIWLADVTGEGAYQALVSSARQWQLLDLTTGQSMAAGEGRILATVNGSDGVGLLTQHNEDLHWLAPGPGRWPVARLRFSGQEDAGQSMRSNASGLGTAFVARSNKGWFAGSTLAADSGPGQSLQPAVVGMAGQALQSLAIDWSDGVFQSELDLALDATHTITETQRQLASCPVLFVWDGQGYEFVTDVLGVGGIGFNLGFGQYGEPRPHEALLLPANLVVGGATLRLMIAEPMEESAYIDQVRATAVDVPPGWQVVLDERLGTGPPQVTGQLLWTRTLVSPTAAQDHRGQSVLTAVQQRDKVAAKLPAIEPQLLGLLAERQQVTLSFPDLSRLTQPVLIFDGWLEYGYSQTSFAAWQGGRVYDAVTLDIYHAGAWHSWLPNFGYPAGMPREASVPLGQLPAGVSQLRLSTDQQIYFDRLAVAATEPPPAHRQTALNLSAARLKRIGFPRRSNGPQLQPNYDYSRREPFWDTRYPQGQYTRLGEVSELVLEQDNALAIVGPGDGLELEFSGDLPELPPGWQRRWLLHFSGWAKDMDLLTRDGETVGPLPALPVAVDRSDALHERYNLRYQQGR